MWKRATLGLRTFLQRCPGQHHSSSGACPGCSKRRGRTQRNSPCLQETGGEATRVTIDGQPAACHKSSGIGHATKSKIKFGGGGKDAFSDDLKVWNAVAAAP